MGDPEIVTILAVMTTPLSMGLFALYHRAQGRIHALELQLARLEAQDIDAPLADEGRLAQVEDQLDGVMLQLERLASGQDFLARVMSERRDLPMMPAPRPAESITPH